MAAARRYAIAGYDRTGLARTHVHASGGRHLHRGHPGRLLRPLHVRRSRAAGRWLAEPLRLHPGGAHPRPWHRRDDRRLPGRPGRRGHDGPRPGPDRRRHRALAHRRPARRCDGLSGPRGPPWPWSRWASAGTAPTATPMPRRSHGSAAAGSCTRPPCGASSACSRPPSWTTAWPSSGSRRRAPRCRSGTRCVCWARSPGCCWSTAPPCSSSSASAARSGRSVTRPLPTGLSWPWSGSPG